MDIPGEWWWCALSLPTQYTFRRKDFHLRQHMIHEEGHFRVAFVFSKRKKNTVPED